MAFNGVTKVTYCSLVLAKVTQDGNKWKEWHRTIITHMTKWLELKRERN